MAEKIVELYPDELLADMRRRIKRWTAALCVIAAAALIACAGMAASVTTASAERLELTAVAVSTVAGWVVIYGGVFVVAAARRELSHGEMLRTEERVRVEGIPTVTKERIVIRGSITARRVEMRGDGGEVRRLLVCETRAKALSEAETAAVYTAHGYVAAYEVKS